MQELVMRIGALRRGLKRLYLLHGVGRLLLTAAAAAAFLFAADYLLVLPAAARVTLFVLAVGVSALVFLRHVSFPLRKSISDDALVIELERANPGLQDVLISALQLSRRRDEPGEPVSSRAMVEATITGALDRVQSLDFSSVLRSRKPVASFLAGAVSAAAIAVFAASDPDSTGIFLNRVWGGPAAWPPKTILLVENPVSSSSRISMGDDLVVRVRVEKRVPSRMWLKFEFPDSGESGEARMVKSGDDLFEYPFSGLVSKVRFRVQGGDARTDEYEVGVLEPPRIQSISAWIRPPAYTKATPTPEGSPLLDGNISAPAGTAVRIRIESTKDLKEARLAFQGAENPVAMTLTGPRTAERSFEVLRNDRYSIDLTDSEGLKNRTPSSFSIRAGLDARPRITVSTPETTSFFITPQASVPFVFKVEDDFGIRSVEMMTGRGTRDQDMSRAALEQAGGPPSEPFGPRLAEYSVMLEFSSILIQGEDGSRTAAEGDLIRVKLVASDYCEPAPNQAPSAEYKFTVVSKAKLENMVEERMLQLKDTLRKARDEQQKVMNSLENLKLILSREDVWDSGDREKLVGSQNAQRSVGQRIAGAAREFERILSTVRMNRLGDPDYQRKIEEMGVITGHLASDRSPEAIAGMEDARAAQAREGQSRGVTRATKAQGDVVHALDELLERMERWEDYNEVIKILRDIRERQEAVREETLEEAKGREKGK